MRLWYCIIDYARMRYLKWFKRPVCRNIESMVANYKSGATVVIDVYISDYEQGRQNLLPGPNFVVYSEYTESQKYVHSLVVITTDFVEATGGMDNMYSIIRYLTLARLISNAINANGWANADKSCHMITIENMTDTERLVLGEALDIFVKYPGLHEVLRESFSRIRAMLNMETSSGITLEDILGS